MPPLSIRIPLAHTRNLLIQGPSASALTAFLLLLLPLRHRKPKPFREPAVITAPCPTLPLGSLIRVKERIVDIVRVVEEDIIPIDHVVADVPGLAKGELLLRQEGEAEVRE